MRATFLGARKLRKGGARRLRATLRRIGQAFGMRDGSVGVMFTDDEGIRRLNARFRGRAEPTDVLSFAGGDPDYLGDLVISVERAREQAEEHGHSEEDEIEVLLLHGVLHLLGHDHETDGGRMRRLENRMARLLFGSRRALVERAGRPRAASRRAG